MDRTEAAATGRDHPRVLLVEDDVLVADVLAHILEDAEYEVDGPHLSLSEGMAALADHLPDCALIDVRLNDQDAFLLADDLTQYGIPFAFCTGSRLPGKFAHRFGHVPVVPKPFREVDLVRAVDCLMH